MSENTLELWTMPRNYAGEVWPNYYVFLSRHRDSDAVENSNFRSGLAKIGGESETVIVVREGHCLVGWVEWIAIHDDDEKALAEASKIKDKLKDYSVVDENDLSELENEEANLTWKNCYSEKERIEYIRKYSSQFEFSDFAEMLAVVRGKYFIGYASDLIY